LATSLKKKKRKRKKENVWLKCLKVIGPSTNGKVGSYPIGGKKRG